jgi:hypothetical protein
VLLPYSSETSDFAANATDDSSGGFDSDSEHFFLLITPTNVSSFVPLIDLKFL